MLLQFQYLQYPLNAKIDRLVSIHHKFVVYQHCVKKTALSVDETHLGDFDRSNADIPGPNGLDSLSHSLSKFLPWYSLLKV